jgi:hypothetical protein
VGIETVDYFIGFLCALILVGKILQAIADDREQRRAYERAKNQDVIPFKRGV